MRKMVFARRHDVAVVIGVVIAVICIGDMGAVDIGVVATGVTTDT